MSAKESLTQEIKSLPGFRPVITLDEIITALTESEAITPVPSRPTLIRMCQDGTFETTTNGEAKVGKHYVYKDSFLQWLSNTFNWKEKRQ